MIPDGKMGPLEPVNPHYMSVDPGVTTGITFWDADGKPLHYNEFDETGFQKTLDYLEAIGPDSNFQRIIVEEWVLYQKLALAQSGSRMEASQIIGMCKRTSYVLGLEPVVEIRADAKETAAKWSGTRWDFKKRTHMPNWMASYLIGYYWLHRQGIIPARVLEQS